MTKRGKSEQTSNNYLNVDMKKFIKIAEAFHLAQSAGANPPRLIELTGKEPFLYRDQHKTIVHLIKGLRAKRFIIKITTNGSLLSNISNLKDEVESLRISFHNMDKESYKKITGVDKKEMVLNNIIRAKKAGFKVTINRLVIESYMNDFEEYIDFVVKNGLRLKLLQLHFSSKDFAGFKEEGYFFNEIIMKYIKPLSVSNPEIYTDDNLSYKMVYPLKNGASVVIRLPIGDGLKHFEYCRGCDFFLNCYKSTCLLPTAAKLTPDYRLFFCSVKNEPFIDLKALEIEKLSVGELADYFRKELARIGLWPNKGFYLPIRAIITSACNFKCYFCHSEGYKYLRRIA